MRQLGSVTALMALAGAISPIFLQATTPEIKNVFWQPNELQQGSVAFITVELERVPLRLTGKLIGKNLASHPFVRTRHLGSGRGKLLDNVGGWHNPRGKSA
jgi:hypothetical protein